jgi:hypothetical protein
MKLPEINSRWRHHNGRVYKVLMITNLANLNHNYPPQVVYQSEVNGNLWSRPVDSWEGKFTELK